MFKKIFRLKKEGVKTNREYYIMISSSNRYCKLFLFGGHIYTIKQITEPLLDGSKNVRLGANQVNRIGNK